MFEIVKVNSFHESLNGEVVHAFLNLVHFLVHNTKLQSELVYLLLLCGNSLSKLVLVLSH